MYEKFEIIECEGFQVMVESEGVKDIVTQALQQAAARNWYCGPTKNLMSIAQANHGKTNIFALATSQVSAVANSDIYYHANKPYEIRLSTTDPHSFIEKMVHEISHGHLELANPHLKSVSPEASLFAKKMREALCKDFISHMKNRNNYVPLQKQVSRLIFGFPHADYPIKERIAERICFGLQAAFDFQNVR